MVLIYVPRPFNARAIGSRGGSPIRRTVTPDTVQLTMESAASSRGDADEGSDNQPVPA
jgi:hypothetical protein